jgi:hypothetical protein
MEDAMKTYAMFAAGLLIASLPAMGQDLRQEQKPDAPAYGTVYSLKASFLQKAVVNYAAALHSECDGVVESSIAHSTLLRIVAQELDMSKVHSALADLADQGRTPAIRYKAYLATAVFDNPAKFENTLRVRYTDSEQFFNAVASQVHKTLLGHNIR